MKYIVVGFAGTVMFKLGVTNTIEEARLLMKETLHEWCVTDDGMDEEEYYERLQAWDEIGIDALNAWCMGASSHDNYDIQIIELTEEELK